VAAGLCTDARFRTHVAPGNHPERPARLTAVEDELAARGLVPERNARLTEASDARLVSAPARPATRAELEAVHAPHYLDALERTVASGGRGWLDPDTFYSDGSWPAALLAAGAAIDLSRRVLDGELATGLALVRPPGHHATPTRAMGFCLLNSVAAAAALLHARGARVAIFDWDVHHGNGTEEIFYAEPDVLYASMHEWPQYPGTGRAEDRGVGRGLGATVNVPLRAGTDGPAYLEAFSAVVEPAIAAFRPDLILVSAGFDAHRDDPIGGLDLVEETYAELTRRLRQIQPRLTLVLEGGYDLAALARSAARVLETLLDAT
jgi:acetoin utilization deacetylase AcuC-like enzyme